MLANNNSPTSYKRQSSISLIKSSTSKLLNKGRNSMMIRSLSSESSSRPRLSNGKTVTVIHQTDRAQAHIKRSCETTPQLSTHSDFSYQINSTPGSQTTSSSYSYLNSSPTVSDFSFNSYEYDSVSSTNNSLKKSTSSTASKRKTKIKLNEICCICDELLKTKLAGETIIGLSCHHNAHYNCLLMLLSLDDSNCHDSSSSLNIICPLCEDFVDIEENVKDDLIQAKLLDDIHGNEYDDEADEDDNNNYSYGESSDRFNLITPVNDLNKFKDLVTPINQVGDNYKDFLVDHNPNYKLSNINRIDSNKHTCNLHSPNSPHNDYFDLKSISPTERLIIKPRHHLTSSSSPISNVFANSPNSTESVNEFEDVKLDIVPQYSKVEISESSKERFKEITCLVDVNMNGNSSHKPSNLSSETNLTEKFSSKEIEFIFYKLDYSIPDLLYGGFVDLELDDKTYNNLVLFVFVNKIVILNEFNEKPVIENINTFEHISLVFVEELDTVVAITTKARVKTAKITVLLNLIETPEFNLKTSNSQLINYFKLIEKKLNVIKSKNVSNENSLDNMKPFSIGQTGSLTGELVTPLTTAINLVLVISLAYNEDLGLSTEEYTQKLKQSIAIILYDLLTATDKFALVFIDKPLGSTLGSYYGCTEIDWDGWQEIIHSIEINEAQSTNTNKQLENGIKFVELLLNFQDTDTVIQVIIVSPFIYNVGITDNDPELTVSESVMKKKSAPLHKKIEHLCEAKSCSVTFILLIDEFKFLPLELYEHYEATIGFKNTELANIRNYIRHMIIMDFEALNEEIALIITQLHKVQIKNFTSVLKFDKECVKLVGVETNGMMMQVDNNHDSNELVIKMNNINHLNLKSFLIKLRIDLEKVGNNHKIEYVNQTTSLQLVTFNKQKTTERNLSLRFINDLELNNTNTLSSMSLTNFGDDGVGDASENFEILLLKCESLMQDAKVIKRQIIFKLLNLVQEDVIQQKDAINYQVKETIKAHLRQFERESEVSVRKLDNSNTKRLNKINLQSWLADEVTPLCHELIDGYSMRNYQLSNIKLISEFFKYT